MSYGYDDPILFGHMVILLKLQTGQLRIIKRI